MLRPREELIQFIWKHKLLIPGPYRTVGGRVMKLIRTGDLNTDSGPDFFNASIELDGVTLAGNIEIHVRTSDWTRHQHEGNAAYDKIILHAVYQHDQELSQNTEHGVDVLELRTYIRPGILERYAELSGTAKELPCAAHLGTVDDICFLTWLSRMRVERLEQKSRRLEALFQECEGDYARLMYILLLSNFGFRINSVPFELIARQLPLQILLRHRDQLQQLEALLLGTAGLLDDHLTDPYMRSLQNEYVFLCAKYRLFPLDKSLLKLSRMRPGNFPALRLAQFAACAHKSPSLFTDPLGEEDPARVVLMLTAGLSIYWQSHYTTTGTNSGSNLRIGEKSAQNIIINTLAPFHFFYGKKTGSVKHRETAIKLLEYCATEDNVKTRHFQAKARLLKDAGDSQGIINLFDKYCSFKKCLSCGVGTAIINGNQGGGKPLSTAGERDFLYL